MPGRDGMPMPAGRTKKRSASGRTPIPTCRCWYKRARSTRGSPPDMSARSWRITGRGFVLAMSMVAAAAYAYSARSKTLAARWVEPVTGMEFALLPAGDFIAGSPGTEPGHRDDEVMYPVRIARAFYMATHEVTRAEW